MTTNRLAGVRGINSEMDRVQEASEEERTAHERGQSGRAPAPPVWKNAPEARTTLYATFGTAYDSAKHTVP